MRLENKVCLITGGGKGIGSTSAKVFAAEGAIVEIADVDTFSMQETVTSITDGGGRAYGCHVDVTNEEDILAWKQEVMNRHGRVDVIFNNAGISAIGALHEVPRDVWNHVMAVNLTGIYLVSQAFIPIMLTQNYGVMINMSSSIAHTGLLRRAAYAATKGAVLAMTKSMQVDYAPYGIRVTPCSQVSYTLHLLKNTLANLTVIRLQPSINSRHVS